MTAIFVTMRLAPNTTYPEPRDAISHDWSHFMGLLGLVPILVPNALADPTALLDAVPGRGLLLTGGDDLGPLAQAGETGAPTARDRTEHRVLEAALARNLPVFGVCRGLHVINAFFGGTVTRRLDAPHVAVEHEVTVEASAGGLTAGARHMVNSFHNNGIRRADLAPDLRVLAASADGCVEGLYHPDRPIVAIQWHPERPNPAQAADRVLFRTWLGRCA
jgi:gamma-glutamyl-gamma-aminobutyrate hydrolase PuuD